MTKEEKYQKEDNFKAWIATINERINDWLNDVGIENSSKFDYSIESLDVIEKYLITKYKLADLKDSNNKVEIDAVLSYVLEVFRRNWPTNEYLIELEDERNILFNRPAIQTKPAIGMAFSPYQILPSTLNLKRIGGFRKIFESKRKQYIEQYGE